MKVLYNEKLDLDLSKWGIEIPLLISRAKSCKDFLVKKFGPDSVTHIESDLLLKEDLLRCHNNDFVERLLKTNTEDEIIKAYELKDEKGNYNRYCPSKAVYSLNQLMEVNLAEASITYEAMSHSLRHKKVFFLGGGMHHAMSFGGRGFCVINDIVIGLRKLQFENQIKRAWVIDLDAHKGDGTAELTFADPTISTLSIHMGKGWPLDQNNKGPWETPSSIDIPIFENEEEKYVQSLSNGLQELKNNYEKPDIAIVVAGSDPYKNDILPSANLLKLEKNQMLERDMKVYNLLSDLNISQTWLMSGGYGPNVWEVYTQFIEKVI